MVSWREGNQLTLQNQLTFSDLTFGDYFLLCPLSPISPFSYLNSHVPLLPLPPPFPFILLAPSDVSSPLVVMATSSSITVTWQSPSQTNGLVTFYSVVATPNSTVGLSSPAGGAQTTIFNVQTPQMTLQAVVTGLQPATTYLVSVAAFTVGGQGMGPPAAISTLESGKQEMEMVILISISPCPPPHLKTTTHISN